ncbi:hypothetical protein PQX77_019088 [Marasmius sp. AFHP31]|nr:hypothetical protein PQX77_019088 [Marasmius sp. AFHP31]
MNRPALIIEFPESNIAVAGNTEEMVACLPTKGSDPGNVTMNATEPNLPMDTAEEAADSPKAIGAEKEDIHPKGQETLQDPLTPATGMQDDTPVQTGGMSLLHTIIGLADDSGQKSSQIKTTVLKR